MSQGPPGSSPAALDPATGPSSPLANQRPRRRASQPARYSAVNPRSGRHRWLLAALLLWALALRPAAVLARQSAHQTCPGCPHQQHLHRKAREGDAADEADLGGIDPDDLRLEAIKHQILSKLGLRNRPDVNRTMASVPKRLALETIYRAEQQPAAAGGRGSVPGTPPKPQQRHYDYGNGYDGNHVDPYADSFGGNGDDYYRGGTDDVEDVNGRNLPPPYQDYDDPYGPSEPDVVDDFYARTSEIITFAEPGES